jgi:vacuolar-type H+-ATPase subunit I/STV1
MLVYEASISKADEIKINYDIAVAGGYTLFACIGVNGRYGFNGVDHYLLRVDNSITYNNLTYQEINKKELTEEVKSITMIEAKSVNIDELRTSLDEFNLSFNSFETQKNKITSLVNNVNVVIKDLANENDTLREKLNAIMTLLNS